MSYVALKTEIQKGSNSEWFEVSNNMALNEA